MLPVVDETQRNWENLQIAIVQLAVKDYVKCSCELHRFAVLHEENPYIYRNHHDTMTERKMESAKKYLLKNLGSISKSITGPEVIEYFDRAMKACDYDWSKVSKIWAKSEEFSF